MMRSKPFIEKLIAIAAALLVWQVAAMLMNSRLLLVTPAAAAARLFELFFEPSFWSTIGFSFLRIVSGFLSAAVIGTALALLAYRVHLAELLIWPYMTTVKSVPVASFVILCLLWFSSSYLSIIISFLMVLPIIYTNVLQGLQSTDSGMLEMARVFRIPWWKRLTYIYIPHLKSYLLSAFSVSLGLSWKSGIAAEVIGIPDGSIGEMLYEAKIYLSSSDLFAWTMVIVLVSFAFEKAFLWLIRRLYRRLEAR